MRRGGERGEGGERGKEGERKGDGERKKGGEKISAFLSDVLGFQLLNGMKKGEESRSRELGG